MQAGGNGQFTVAVSANEGKTWKYNKLGDGYGKAYTLCVNKNDKNIVYTGGESHPKKAIAEKIITVKFTKLPTKETHGKSLSIPALQRIVLFIQSLFLHLMRM